MCVNMLAKKGHFWKLLEKCKKHTVLYIYQIAVLCINNFVLTDPVMRLGLAVDQIRESILVDNIWSEICAPPTPCGAPPTPVLPPLAS